MFIKLNAILLHHVPFSQLIGSIFVIIRTNA